MTVFPFEGISIRVGCSELTPAGLVLFRYPLPSTAKHKTTLSLRGHPKLPTFSLSDKVYNRVRGGGGVWGCHLCMPFVNKMLILFGEPTKLFIADLTLRPECPVLI